MCNAKILPSRVASVERQTYNKTPLDIKSQILLLRDRGLIIENTALAEHSLNHIGYYRLSGYGQLFYIDSTIPEHAFRLGTSFEKILDYYRFDRELRVLMLDAIEKIEVSVKSLLANLSSLKHGAHWYLDSQFFATEQFHTRFIKAVGNTTGKFHGCFYKVPVIIAGKR